MKYLTYCEIDNPNGFQKCEAFETEEAAKDRLREIKCDLCLGVIADREVATHEIFAANGLTNPAAS